MLDAANASNYPYLGSLKERFELLLSEQGENY